MWSSRFRGDGALDQHARLVDGIELIGVDRAWARDADLERVDLAADDPGARTLAHRDDADRRQRLDRAAHSLTADRQQRGEVTFARQFLADLKNPRRDERRELVADPFAHRAPADLGSQMRSLGENAGRLARANSFRPIAPNAAGLVTRPARGPTNCQALAGAAKPAALSFPRKREAIILAG